jgi:hypothetical protein
LQFGSQINSHQCRVFPAEILDLRQYRDKKNSQKAGCSFAVIGCSVMAVKVCNTGKAASLSISIMLL